MMRKPLGRGLDALIGTAAAGIEIGADIDNGGGGAHFKMAPAASITAGPFQPRINFDAERLAELTRAIQSQGIIEPLIVRRIAVASAAAGEIDGPRYELIAGERRLDHEKVNNQTRSHQAHDQVFHVLPSLARKPT